MKFNRKILIAIVITFFSLVVCNYPKDKGKILIVADEWPPMLALSEIIKENGKYKIDTVSQERVQQDLSDYRFVFMYVHKVLLENTETALINYANQGGKLIVLHHGIASAKMENPAWLEFLRIKLYPRKEQFGWNVLQHVTHTMVNLAPGHFITTNNIKYEKNIYFISDYSNTLKGEFQAFDLPNTEIFLNQRFTNLAKKKILYGFYSGDSNIMQPTSGWYQKTGKGWLFYYQAGHQIGDFQNPNFKQVLINTLEWEP